MACLTAVWIADLFFRVEVMHHSGTRALYVSCGLLLVAFALTVGLCMDSLWLLIAALRRNRPRTDAIRGFVILCVVAAGPAAHRLLPDLPFESFLWRHENEFLEDIRSGSSDEGIRHYGHGSTFRFSWYTISNCWFYIVYEPDRPPGQQLLGRDTDTFYPQGHSVRHLRGPWYAVFH